MIPRSKSAALRARLFQAASAAVFGVVVAPTAAAIVANGETNTPDTLIDTTGLFPNVGLIMIDQWNAQDGDLFTCTATLINPRMMLTAAHCVAVGDEPDGEFYSGAFGERVGVTFLPNPLSGEGGHVLTDYLSTGAGNPYALTMSDVIVQPGYDGFPEGDVAVLALSVPIPTRGVGKDAATIGTMPVLMSRLDRLERVWTVGYGLTGTGAAPGTQATRRRVAQNMLGFIGSFNEFQDRAYADADWEAFGLYADADFQTFYMTDMDDPRRGTDDAFAYDFDVFPGDALSTDDPHTSEGISSSGDSGGPLFLATPDGPVQLTVNSGGAYFNDAVASSGFFGGANFQTPLYLYANWIALNDPTKYLAARDGNFDWTDAAAWQETLDPAFVVRDAGGHLVGGIAAIDQGQVEEDRPSIGDINKAPFCFYEGTESQSVYGPGLCGNPDEAPAQEVAAPVPAHGRTAATIGAERYEIPAGKTPNDPPSAANRPGYGVAWTPRAWVPNNTDGDTANPDAPATYFDVTLGGAGVITLAGFDATIDRLSLISAARELHIAGTGSLTTWLSPELYAGLLTVDGTLISRRNIWQMGGILAGHGRIALNPTALFGETTGDTLYNVAGIVSPGTPFTAETLTIQGHVQFSSASAYAVTLAGGQSDLLNVVDGALDADGAALRVTVPGVFAEAGPRYGSMFRVIQTGDGLLTGTFKTVKDDLPGVLFAAYGIDTAPDGADYGVLTIEADAFTDHADFTVREAETVAAVLDAARDRPGGAQALRDVYDVVDLLDGPDLQAAFQTMVPYNAIAAVQASDVLSGLTAATIRDRASEVAHGGGRGLAMAGTQMLGLGPQLASSDPYDAMMMGAASVAAAQAQAAETAAMQTALLKEGYGVFLSVGALVNADIKLTGGLPDAGLDGFTGVLGLDYAIGESFVGGAVTYATGSMDELFGLLQRAEVESWGGTIYGGARFDDAVLTVYGGYADQSYQLGRTIPAIDTIVPGRHEIEASPGGDIWSLGARVGYDIVMADGLLTPFIGLDGRWISLDGYTEDGRVGAYILDDSRTAILQGRIGLDYAAAFALDDGGLLTPTASLAVVGDLADDAVERLAAFADFPAVPMMFAGPERDNAWFEYAVGLAYAADDIGISVSYAGADTGQAAYGTVTGRLSVAW